MNNAKTPIETGKKRQKSILGYFKENESKKRRNEGEDHDTDSDIGVKCPSWTHVNRNNLNISYAVVLEKLSCEKMFDNLETEIEYFTGELATVKVFGKYHPIPRQQSAYGDEGLTYKYSGTTVPALAWTSSLAQLRDLVGRVAGVRYNFVLVNRYRDGNDKMGDHKDDEKELDREAPIASLTLGAERDFVFKHQDRKTNNVEDYRIVLRNGMLLLMKHPTNSYWYHGLPQRKKCSQPRINLTFRVIKKT